jgi:hypothetical protein
MADLSKNSIWTDLEKKSDNVETELLGPAYNYSDHVPGPASLGAGTDGSLGQLVSNTGAVISYVKTLITGDPPLGNQYFINTGGTCTAPDGSLQPRYNYINNLSSGAGDLPAAMSELGSDFNGLVPGVLGDIESLNPTYMFTALTSDSSPPCACYLCQLNTDPNGGGYNFLTPELTPDFSSAICAQVDQSYCMKKTKESFTNRSEHSILPFLIAGGLFMLLIFSAKKLKV